MSDDAINSPLVLQSREAALSAEKPADAYVTVRGPFCAFWGSLVRCGGRDARCPVSDAPVPSKPIQVDARPMCYERVTHECGCWEERSISWVYAYGQCDEHKGEEA